MRLDIVSLAFTTAGRLWFLFGALLIVREGIVYFILNFLTVLILSVGRAFILGFEGKTVPSLRGLAWANVSLLYAARGPGYWFGLLN